MDPGGNGATMNTGGEGGPSPPGWGEDKQLVPNSGDGLTFIGCQKTKKTGSARLRHAQSMYHCVCQSTVTLMIVIMNSVLPVYLFQENKSYGSKKPFAFIL